MGHRREPTLDEILNEPIIRKVMKSDGYTPDDIRLLMWQASVKANRNGATYMMLPSVTDDVGLQRMPASQTLDACCQQPSA
jgi:hypothetical protein